MDAFGNRKRRPLVIGHRGASGYRPEHTRSAYQLAFDLGVDAVEPDVVATRDGVLVLRHENDITGTTNVAERPEFADRRTTKVIDGEKHTGWFTEDFDWAELATLTSRERMPDVRGGSSEHDGREGILRLTDLLDMIEATGRRVGLVVEIKHATYFASIGLPLDVLVAAALARYSGWEKLTIECFERTVLGQLQRRGLVARYVYLCERRGSAPDQVARFGSAAPSYAHELGPGLEALAAGADGVRLDGVSLDKAIVLDDPGVVARAQAFGLDVFVWTLRPENRFLHSRHRGPGGPAAWGNWRDEFAEILATGVDGVFVDHPDLLTSDAAGPEFFSPGGVGTDT